MIENQPSSDMKKKKLMNVLSSPLSKPIPWIFGLILLVSVIYFLTTEMPLYDYLELDRNNPLSLLTSIFIHDLEDQGTHFFSNMIQLSIFGYIVSIQTSPKKMIVIFFVCGLVSNLIVVLFIEGLNNLLLPRYMDWAISQGIIITDSVHRLFSSSGGGASDAILSLIAFSVVYSCYYFLRQFLIAFTEYDYRSWIVSLKKELSSNFTLTLTNFVALLGIMTMLERFWGDIEMFTYTVSYLYAFSSGSPLSYPRSRGHPFLAHIIGSLLGIISCLCYLFFDSLHDSSLEQTLKLDKTVKVEFDHN